MKSIFSALFLALFIFLSASAGFSMGGKVKSFPALCYTNINIPDGELLHYGVYNGKEKTMDAYFAARRETGKNSGLYYRFYLTSISFPNTKKPALDYTRWPQKTLIDPKHGWVLDSLVSYETNLDYNPRNDTNDISVKMGLGGMVYDRFQMFPEGGYVLDAIQSVRENQTNLDQSRVPVDTNYPCWDMTSMVYYLGRFIDPKSGGLLYMAAPALMKTPIAFSLVQISSENLQTLAGNFRVIKSNVIAGDPFMGKLMGPFLKNYIIWTEDSSSRRIIKMRTPAPGYELILEEISNIH